MIKRIGILGGTFNPIHLGHLTMAEMACEQFSLDKVFFVPCHLPPHKTIQSLVSADKRLNMVKLAIKGNAKFDYSDFEIKKGGKSYSIDTVLYFRKRFGTDIKIYFLIGEDHCASLKQWRRYDDLARLTKFIVINRPGSRQRPRPKNVLALNMPMLEISSSEIRRRIGQGKSARYYLPESVYQYIRRNHLYTSSIGKEGTS